MTPWPPSGYVPDNAFNRPNKILAAARKVKLRLGHLDETSF